MGLENDIIGSIIGMFLIVLALGFGIGFIIGRRSSK